MRPRPRLHPHIRVLRRTDTSLQVGARLTEGIVLDGLTRHEMAYLESLAAGSPSSTPRPSRAGELLAALNEAGLLRTRPAPVLRVALCGDGLAADDIRRALTEAGVHVVTAAAPSRPGTRRPRIDLALLVDVGAVPSVAGESWLNAGVPHLPVALDAQCVTVGPIVTAGGPCLRCLDLARCEADPRWPELCAQTTGLPAWNEGAETPASLSVRALAVAVTLSAAHTFADARDLSTLAASRTWHVTRGITAERPWARDPRCPAHAPGSVHPDTSSSPAYATMAP